MEKMEIGQRREKGEEWRVENSGEEEGGRSKKGKERGGSLSGDFRTLKSRVVFVLCGSA